VLRKTVDDASISNYLQLRDCMSLGKVGGFVADAYQRGTGAKQTCFAQATAWKGWQLSGQVTSLPQDQCFGYQNTFMAESSNCMSTVGAWLKGGEIAGIVIGGVAGAALLAFAAYYVCSRRPSCPRVPYRSFV